LPSSDVTAEVVQPGHVPPHLVDALSSRAGLFASRPQLEWLWEDSRWADRLVAVSQAGRLVGLLPLSISRLPNWPDQLHDVSKAADEADCTASDTYLLGGRGDIRGSILLDFSLGERERCLVASQAVQVALHVARADRRHCAALYVPAEETELSAALRTAGLTPRPAPARSVIRWPAATLDSYLAFLAGSHREIVRRDWRRRDAMGLSATSVRWDQAIEPAAPLITAILAKHGYQTHAKLVAMRLRRWGTILGPNGFALRADAAGECLGYAFGWCDSNATIVYEVGLQFDGSALSRAAYLELLIYGPLTASCDRGLRVLDLGMFANEPKRLRGASHEPACHWILKVV